MKKLILLIILLLVNLKLFAPNNEFNLKPLIERDIVKTNLDLLKNNQFKTREEVFKLVQPVIEIYLNEKDYKQYFPNLQDSISYGLSCIFVSESSNSLGQSAMSSLWIKYNNPFGLTCSKGKKLLSWEMINGERIIMYRNFQTFTSFQDAIDSLMNSLQKENYNKTRNSTTVQEFLFNLQRNGYCTNKYWPKWAYNKIYLKYKS